MRSLTILGALLIILGLAVTVGAIRWPNPAALAQVLPQISDAGPSDAGADAAPDASGLVWTDSEGRDCHRYQRRTVCEGPRRVPVPTEEASARATRLGLLTGRMRGFLMSGNIPEAVWAEVRGQADQSFLWPVPSGRLWRGFGPQRGVRRVRGRVRRSRRRVHHDGLDIGGPEGIPIVSARDGLVLYSDNGFHGYGNVAIVGHADRSMALYAHCQELHVTAGEFVVRGQQIALVGQTGLAHGPHLHFEVRVAGRLVDPAPLLVRDGSASAPGSTPSAEHLPNQPTDPAVGDPAPDQGHDEP